MTDLERNIARRVVDRFVKDKKPTSKLSLIREFRNPDVVDKMAWNNIVKALGPSQGQVLPTALTFHLSEDEEALKLARNGVTSVLRALQGLFDGTEIENAQFSPTDVHRWLLKQTEFPPTEEELWLGLYFAPEFNAVSSFSLNEEQTEIKSFRISPQIVKLKDFSAVWDEKISLRLGYLMDANLGKARRNAFTQREIDASTDSSLDVDERDFQAKRVPAISKETIADLRQRCADITEQGKAFFDQANLNSSSQFHFGSSIRRVLSKAAFDQAELTRGAVRDLTARIIDVAKSSPLIGREDIGDATTSMKRVLAALRFKRYLILRPAGRWGDALLYGELGTAHELAFARELIKSFQSALKKSFKNIQHYYVGASAYGMLQAAQRTRRALSWRNKRGDPTSFPAVWVSPCRLGRRLIGTC